MKVTTLVERESGWKGHESLVPLLVPVASIESHPRNPRRGAVDVVARSLDTYGQTKPIVVQNSTSWIVAGNHTKKAVERLGWDEIAVVRVEMNEEEALGYLLMDNKSSDLGEYDTSGLIELLEEAAESGRLAMTGYEGDDLDDLIAANERDARNAAEFAAGQNDEGGEGGGPPTVRGSGDGVREVVLLYSEEQHENFARWVRSLQHEYGTDSQSEAIYEAVKRSARDA